ncbi:S-adenosyl-L-methionine-dependent methyltransferase [Truncatella angustata]|uniref:tRNA (uracil(54)-C(5))-methyltransferase n=1 Tax=Truncatella angustata TaxID=152316 RepID=A0A9P8UG96_9PEZI|nr:S-adenosyl-L-methionine-dependent methyltransferase [Truncatella angustata]KAH6651568.1 S-adenosyl-L-methionine-dependent methyltransferase [Truncatella angustata]
MASSALPVSTGAPSNGVHQSQQGQQGQQGQQRAGGKRAFQQGGRKNKKAKKRERDMKSGSHEEVLGLDIEALLASQRSSPPAEGAGEETVAAGEVLPEPGSEIELDVVELSSTGDGLAQQKGFKQVYVVPFVVPGDTIKVKVYRHMTEGYTVADLISVLSPSPKRDDSRIQCKYFSKCSGCQFQMLDYSEQLRLKRRIVEKAFRNFSQLPPELIPAIQDTIGSPLQYNYRTKLTPHFDGPKGWFKRKNVQPFESRPNVGFTPKGTSKTMDIEDCPIGTDAVRLGMKLERDRMDVEYAKYLRGGTILLREDTKRVKKDASSMPEDLALPTNAIKVEADHYVDYKTCITDNNGTSTEYIDDFVFKNSAGSFFQNNNSILPSFTEHIRQNVFPPTTGASADASPNPIKYLIDAYCGSGLFTVTLSSVFESSTGIDIDPKGIQAARMNAEANSVASSRANFIAADANELFKSVSYPPDETVVILDPPRKGCDANFLRQLLQYGPKRVVYVSCNVHTQARDVGMLVRGEAGDGEEVVQVEGHKKIRYEIESLRGFDFFPQTGHVEGLALLNRVEDDTTNASGVADTSPTS